MKKCLYLSMVLSVILVIKAEAEMYKGIEFPQGSISFADSVISYDPVIKSGQPAATFRNIIEALGIPDYTEGIGIDYVSLGDGGSITLQFTDNYLTGSGDNADDLFIFEVGSASEDTYVEISKDNVTWHYLGKVCGHTSGIDIDIFGFGINDLFSYVRLTDDSDESNHTGDNVGADIDAIGAISATVSPEPVNSPPSSAQLISPLNNTMNLETTLEFRGVAFPQGSISFADSVVSYDPVIKSGQPVAAYRGFLEALGVPDYTEGIGIDYVSLGDGGSITLQFTDNYLTGSGDNADDLFIFEVGSASEDTYVEISKDNVTWHYLGKACGHTSGIDIDTFGFGMNDLFSYVRLTDDSDESNQTGDNVGADIDAIGAISATVATEPVNSPPSSAQLISPLNNTMNLETTLEFRWEKSLDPDGDNVIYSHYVCTDGNFTTGCIINENIAFLYKKGIYYAGTGMSILLLGAVFSRGRRFRNSLFLLSSMIVLVTLILLSCGGSKGSGNDIGSSTNEISLILSGIETNTAYFWKVTASDNNGNTSESEVRSFTTK